MKIANPGKFAAPLFATATDVQRAAWNDNRLFDRSRDVRPGRLKRLPRPLQDNGLTRPSVHSTMQSYLPPSGFAGSVRIHQDAPSRPPRGYSLSGEHG